MEDRRNNELENSQTFLNTRGGRNTDEIQYQMTSNVVQLPQAIGF